MVNGGRSADAAKAGNGVKPGGRLALAERQVTASGPSRRSLHIPETLLLGLMLGSGTALSPDVASAQQITQGGGSGGGKVDSRYSGAGGAGGLAGGGGGGAFGSVVDNEGGDGGTAAQVPDGTAQDGSSGTSNSHGNGGAGGQAPSPNNVSSGGGGGGAGGGHISFPGDGGDGGGGGAGNINALPTVDLGAADAGATGAVGVAGAYFGGGGGGGGGGLVLTTPDAAVTTHGYNVAGGAGGDHATGSGGGGGGAAMVLLGGGRVTINAGAGGTSAVTGGAGGDGYYGGHGGAGLFLYGGGALEHRAGTIVGGAGGGRSNGDGGLGGAGVLSNEGMIENNAVITGGNGGANVTGGNAGAGIEAWGGDIANASTATITGGGGGSATSNNPVYNAGAGGVGILFRDGKAAALHNEGQIAGGGGGAVNVGSNVGSGGVGVIGATTGAISIVNSGTIAGGLSGDGAVRANAISLAGSNNRLELWSSSTITGDVVVSGGGANNVLALGGATNGTFNASQIGAGQQYRGFTGFDKTGSSTWTLTGTTAAVTPWTVRQGTLAIAQDDALGASSAALTLDGGTLQTTTTLISARSIVLGSQGGALSSSAGTTATFSGVISGSGDLVKTGGGTLVLMGANSYIGNTAVAAGTLIGNVASIKGDLGNAGTVVFDQTANASFLGDVGGQGGTNGVMTKRGTGILTLAGTSSLNWTIEAGGLVSATDRFVGNAAIGSGASFTFDQAGSGTYAGILSGSGAFAKAGSGVVVLTGDSSAFGGSTAVTGGRLIVGQNGTGTLGGSLTIQSGGLLGGTGNLGSTGSIVTIAAGAVHAPGNSIGVQHVLGDYVNHGTLRIEATSSEADKIVVAGSVDIAGASLDLVLSPTTAASWNVFNGPFTILEKHSAGAVAGTFVDPVTKNLLFLDALLDYAGGDGNDVTLELQRNNLAFASVGQTRNQSATGGAIDTFESSHAVWGSIALTVDPDIVRKSFDALSGEIHASAKSALIEDSRFVRNAIDDRLRAAFAAPGASHAPVLAYGPGDTPVAVAPDEAGPVFWSYGFGSWDTIEGDGNAASLKGSTGGLLIGTDGLVGDWRLGVMAGYSHSRFDVEDRFSSGSSDNYHLGLYGGTQWGNLAFRSGLAYTWNDLSTRRSVAIPGIAESLGVDYHAGTFQAFGEFGYGIEDGAVRFEPFANLAHVSLHTDGFTENGGAAALSGRSDTTDATFTTLGLRAEHNLGLGTVEATLRGMLGWRHAFGDTTPTATQAFLAGDAFTIAGVPIARNSAVIEAGLDLELTPDATFGLSYIGQFASGAQENGFTANLAVRF